MRLFSLARKDLSQILRDRRSAIFLVAMPIVFTAFMGMAFRWSSQTDNRPYVGFINLDRDSLAASNMLSLMDSSGLLRVRVYERSDTAKAEVFVRQDRLDALAIVPDGYGRALMNAEAMPLTIICQENTPDGQAAFRALEAVAQRLLSASEATRLALENEHFDGDAARAIKQQQVMGLAAAAWRRPAFRVSSEKASGQDTIKALRTPTSFEQASPGTLVQFAILGLLNSAMILVLERRNRALQRLLTTSISRTEVIAGHTLAMFLVVLLQGLLLILLGHFLFGVHYLRAPLPVLLVLVSLALWVTGLGMLVGSVAKGQEQVTVWAMIAMFGFAVLGGCWFPLEFTGATFSRIGHLLPSAWAMDGFQNVIVRGLGFNSILLPCGIMLAYAIVFMVIAIWRFRAE